MHRWPENQVRAAASTASINKTLKDIDAILDGATLSRASPKREELRQRIREALAETALKWLRDGFRGGHASAVEALLDRDHAPLTVSRTVSRLLPNGDVPVRFVVKSELPVELAERLKIIDPGA